MSSASNFTDFIQARDAAGLRVFMTNERHVPVDHLERNNRALFEACFDGDDEICEILINFGADVNSVVEQKTPLFIACENAHPACVDLLLAHGVNVNAVNLYYGQTPLIATAREGFTPTGSTLDLQFIDNCCRCMRSLLAAGAAIDQTDNNGSTALIWASCWNFRVTEILVEAGANVNIVPRCHTSALHMACKYLNPAAIELLIRHNADIDIRDSGGLTAFERVMHELQYNTSPNDAVAVLELFLERGALDAMNCDGQTPLHYACLNLEPAGVDWLLLHNADIDIVDDVGCTALQLALNESYVESDVDSDIDDEPAPSTNVLQLMATCAQTRLEASSADWIRLARNERSRPQMALGSMGTARQRRRRQH